MIKDIQKIARQDLPEIEKLAQAFDLVTSSYIANARNEVELLRALGDEENLIKERIKSGVMENARSIFLDCYRVVTGRSAWHE
jgi:hypothetical protein